MRRGILAAVRQAIIADIDGKSMDYDDPWAEVTKQFALIEAPKAADAMVTLIAATEDIKSDYPMATLWVHEQERKYKRPYEIVTSVVRRGDVGVFFDAARGNRMPEQFAESVTRDEWHLFNGQPIDWEAMEAAGDNNMVEEDYEIEEYAREAFDEVVNGGYHESPETGRRTTLYQTENGDILTIPDGMVNTEDTRIDGDENLENEDAYYSWPAETIPANDDPGTFGYELASDMLGRPANVITRMEGYQNLRNNFEVMVEKVVQEGGWDLVWRSK